MMLRGGDLPQHQTLGDISPRATYPPVRRTYVIDATMRVIDATLRREVMIELINHEEQDEHKKHIYRMVEMSDRSAPLPHYMHGCTPQDAGICMAPHSPILGFQQ